jgi:hypothetical protein
VALMAGEIFALLVPPTGSTFIAGHAARASQIERIRQVIVILAKPRYIHCGGQDGDGHDNTAYARLRNTATLELCQEDYRGLTMTARMKVRVNDAAYTVTVRLRNTDDGVTVAEMTLPVSDVTLTEYTAICTLPAGTIRKTCEWQIQVTTGGIGYGIVGVEYGL